MNAYFVQKAEAGVPDYQALIDAQQDPGFSYSETTVAECMEAYAFVSAKKAPAKAEKSEAENRFGPVTPLPVIPGIQRKADLGHTERTPDTEFEFRIIQAEWRKGKPELGEGVFLTSWDLVRNQERWIYGQGPADSVCLVGNNAKATNHLKTLVNCVRKGLLSGPLAEQLDGLAKAVGYN